MSEVKKIDWTKPVQTRDGRKARVLCTDRKSSDFTVIALVTDQDGDENLQSFTSEGTWGTNFVSDIDLINVPETKVSFTAVFTDSFGTSYFGTSYNNPHTPSVESREFATNIGVMELRNTAGKIETVFHPKQS